MKARGKFKQSSRVLFQMGPTELHSSPLHVPTKLVLTTRSVFHALAKCKSVFREAFKKVNNAGNSGKRKS